MKRLYFWTPLALILLCSGPALAETRSLVSGDDPAEVQERAFKQGLSYPVGPLKCDQRCSQWWGRE